MTQTTTKSTITVELPQNPYDIVIATDGVQQLGHWLTQPQLRLGKKILLVSNPMIFKRYGEAAIASLQQAGFDVVHHLIPPGERYKTLSSIQKIYDAALDHRLERSSAMVALGGGVVGDMTGFAAATWMRGLAVVQVPTSLLAMVDASIGGKTGVNHPRGKNLIGAFHQPRLVLIDPNVLATLPAREFRAGMAEVIKYGVIWDANLFEQMEQTKRLDQQRYVPANLIQDILTRSCQAKATVVAQDEKEGGRRAILNYGHTIGHAVESLTGYRVVNHGEAVAIGMVAAGRIAVELNMWQQADANRQDELIKKAGLPTEIPATLDIDKILNSLKSDKKVKDGRVNFILPTKIGAVEIIDNVPEDVLRGVLQEVQAK